jgi:DNA primase
MAIGPGAVATFGVNYTQEQAAKIARYPVRVICFDSESQAQKQAKKLLDTLTPLPGETHNIVLESGKDPAECDPSEIAELRAKFLS